MPDMARHQRSAPPRPRALSDSHEQAGDLSPGTEDVPLQDMSVDRPELDIEPEDTILELQSSATPQHAPVSRRSSTLSNISETDMEER